MSPDEFTDQLVALSHAGLHYAALELAAREGDRLDGPLTIEQVRAVADALRISAAVVPPAVRPSPERNRAEIRRGG